MNDYRRGTVLGLTVAETFILLTFLLLIALAGLIQQDEPAPQPDTPSAPGVWMRPDEIETLKKAATEAREAVEKAEQAQADAERERDQAQKKADQAREAREKAEQARANIERERDQAQKRADQARKAKEKAEQARADAERGREQAQETADQAREAEERAEQAQANAERERDQARRSLAKGKNPPCWYRIVSAGEGKTREKPYYVFNVAIYQDSIELAPRTAPPGRAADDGGGPYADERMRLRIGELPYGRKLSDDEFTDAVSEMVAKGRNGKVRTYECVFSVMVWDKTPEHAKKRWKDAHDRIIEGSFSAYTVRDLQWRGVEPKSGDGN